MTIHNDKIAASEVLNSNNFMDVQRGMNDGSGVCEPVKLKKQLGLLNGVGIIVGIVVGSGIFVSPIGVLQYSGSVGLSLIVWLCCGLLTMCGALCYAELGTLIPKSGADFAYLYEAFNPLFAFLYLWVSLLIIMPTGNAIIALTFADYILQPFFTDCLPPDLAVKLLAACVIMFLTFVNCYEVKWATFIQDAFACAKVLALFIIICAGIVYLSLGNVENLSQPFEDSSWEFGSIAVAFYYGMFSFSGWTALNFVTEELKRPAVDLPRAIYISLPLVSLVYFLTNVSYFAVLSRSEILASTAVAGAFGNKILGVMSWTMPLCVALSTFGGLNGGIFASARLFFVGAREGHLPSCVSMINVNKLTPTPSLIFLGIITIFYLWAGHVMVLINFTSFIEGTFLTLTTSTLLWLRVKVPDKKRIIKVNLCFPVIYLSVGIMLIVLPFFKRPVETSIALGITLSGVPVYYFFVFWKNKPKGLVAISNEFTKIVQKLLLSSPQDSSPDEIALMKDS